MFFPCLRSKNDQAKIMAPVGLSALADFLIKSKLVRVQDRAKNTFYSHGLFRRKRNLFPLAATSNWQRSGERKFYLMFSLGCFSFLTRGWENVNSLTWRVSSSLNSSSSQKF
ncbi:hypothetical protein CEXT_209181 [Caerostris extrusa]|uniref:Uncharacterized protein n=1 Tax=Caerostris extrusa TaxID=172846 RepID=A0AAV4UIJ0_CAEEX|nr:hypothetical protein CEXT_209181 [Caerostris extrusa]